MRGAATAVGFSADGQTAFAVARRAKNSALTVYASRNGGEAYDAHEIDELPTPSTSYSYRSSSSSSAVVRTLAAAEDGTLALVARLNNRDSLIVVDDEGRMISLATAPQPGANIAAVGSRALATLGDRAWESLDGGSSWEEIGRLPIDPCRVAVKSCVRQGVCNSSGCVVGSAVVRVGWRGQADRLDAQRKPMSSDQGTFSDSVLQTPMTCTPSDDGWIPVKGLNSMPGADDIAIGSTAWFGVDFDTVKAQATLFRAKNVRKPKVDRIELLSKVARPTEYAFYGAKQIEGAAVVRYPVGTMKAGAKRYKNVEVTWANLFESGVVRQRIADAGPLIAGDYISRGTKIAASALPNLVSVTPGGLYLRPHRHRRDRQVTYFLDGKQVTKIPEVSWPSSVRGWRREMAHVGSTHVPLVFHPNGSQIVRAVRQGEAWSFTARGVGINRPDRFGLRQQFDMVYAAGKSALHVYQFHRFKSEGTGYVFPFRATGAATDDPLPVPMQSDLPERPSRCTKSQIKRRLGSLCRCTRASGIR